MKKEVFAILVVVILLVTFSALSFALYIQDINNMSMSDKDEYYTDEEIKLVLIEEPLIEKPVYEEPENLTDPISIKLSYNSGTQWDPDDNGIESTQWVVDLTVNETIFSGPIDKSKLCTRWTVFSQDIGTSETLCFGSKEACDFVYLPQEKNTEWNDPLFVYPGRYGSTSNNIISAQVIYIDYSIDPENLYSNIHNSKWDWLPVFFK